MAIQSLTYANALLVADPKYIVLDGNNATVYTGADIPAVNTLARSIIELHPDDNGFHEDGLTTSAAANNSAVMATVANNLPVKFGTGTGYITSIAVGNLNNHLHISGAGYRDTILKAVSTAKSLISVIDDGTTPYSGVNPHDYYQFLTVNNLALMGAGTTGSGIYASGVVWFLFENLYIKAVTNDGITLTEAATPSVAGGSYIGVIRNVKASYCGRDGVRQIATSISNQQNATFLMHTELQYNTNNGWTAWGYKLSADQCTIEGNTGYGVSFENFVAGGGDTAKGLNLSNAYLEENLAGHIHVKTNTTGSNSGVIQGLNISDNFGIYYGALGAAYKSVFFETTNTNPENQVRTLTYKGNVWTHLVEPTVVADFGNMLSHDCRVTPAYTFTQSTIWADIAKVTTQYINLGHAKFDFIKSITCQGLWDAKGGANLTYSTITKSDNIIVSGANTYFKLGSLPFSSEILALSVPVETDSPNYSITFTVLSRGYDTTAAYTTRVTKTISGLSGTQVVKTLGLNDVGVDVRQGFTNLDTILQITVTITTPGVGPLLALGNPTLLHT